MPGAHEAVNLAVPSLSGRQSRKSSTAPGQSLTNSTPLEKQVRKHGGIEWTPVAFTYPPINPSQEPAELKPIPYRPFRTGEYHVTMGIRSMPWDAWIELDNEFEKYYRIREHRIRTRGETVIKVLPETPGVVGSGADAAIETVHEIAEYLSRRFPATFSIERHSLDKTVLHQGWDGLPPVKSVKIRPLGVSYELPLDVDGDANAAVRALEIASLLLEPSDKEKLQLSMERFFQRLSVDKPVSRNNYFFQVVKTPASNGVEDIDPEELAWAESSHGPEDDFLGAHPAVQPTRPTPTPSNVRLRSERQTLRRLPRTGAILFGIRTYLTPLERLAEEPGVARRLAGALRGWGDDIGEYKGKNGGGWWDVVLDYLDKKADEERESGVDDDIKGMDNYPY
ncbi:hypothetical protein H0H87_011382 [Tephrocybe sp. NHM501043]|nr:hypothetical protein H0H87_011382 [Tephrocybe sp. NHM501043]